MKIEDFPIEERPYEKFLKYGEQGLSDIELLTILIRTGTKALSSIDIAKTLLVDEQGRVNLLKLYENNLESLMSIKGIGKVKAIQILALLEMSKRLSRTKSGEKMKWQSPTDVANYFMETLRHKKMEQFLVVYLDTKCKCLGYEEISRGSLNASIVHPREVFKGAILKSAYSIIALHNHPSGDPTPSREDVQITSKLKSSGEMLGIGLLDHIVIGDGAFISLKEQGYL
ncbi:MAG: DNA repair protein RadC [Niameybacter sp.]